MDVLMGYMTSNCKVHGDLETTVGALYNSIPDIEDALHAAGWIMINIVFPGISFGDNVIAAAS
jgi:hypothetical protein